MAKIGDICILKSGTTLKEELLDSKEGIPYVKVSDMNLVGNEKYIIKQGGDNGIDIIAYKDELPPRILVQVKSQNKDIPETVVQSFKGAMLNGDYGLFVTLSDYTPNAKIFLDKNPIIKGINGYELVDLIIKYYDKLNEKYQKVIPLKRVYIPVSV